MIKIFVSDNKRSIILQGEIYTYLIVKCTGKSKKRVFAFDGRRWQQYSGISHRISEWLVRYIQENGVISYSNYKKIFRVLDALYRGEDPNNTKRRKIWLVRKDRMRFTDYSFMTKDEARLLQNNHVYEVVPENLQSDKHGSPMFKQALFKHGAVVGSDGKIRDVKGIVALCKGKEFYVPYNQELYNILCRFTNLEITEKGVLKTQIERSKVPFATVVWAFYDNRLKDSDDVLTQILDIQQELGALEKQIDHLSERKGNNHPLLLAPLHKDINKAFRNKRTRIKRPFYFLNLYLYKLHLILVECGVENSSNIFRFQFDISTLKGQQNYYDYFERFRSIAKATGYITKNPEENLLYRCADPNKFGCKGNPLMGLAYNPLDSYSTDTPETLDILWNVRRLSGSVADWEDSLGLEAGSLTSKLGVPAIQPVTRKLIKAGNGLGMITAEQAADSIQKFCKKPSQNSAVIVNPQ